MAEPKMPEYLESLRPDPSKGRDVKQKSPGELDPAVEKRTVNVRWGGLALGVVLSVLIYFILPHSMSHNARLTAATAIVMAVWWMTEALPIPATALLPLVIFPVLAQPIQAEGKDPEPVTFNMLGASYGSDTIFLFMGGFFIALAMQRWNLHRRIALGVLRVMPNKPGAMIAGFMIATGFVSMWVSNTATAVMMLPIGMSVLSLVNQITQNDDANPKTGSIALNADSEPVTSAVDLIRTNFGSALMLGIAYAASIGSLGTLIGTPPNALLAGMMSDNLGVTIGFAQWMVVGVPISIVMMAVAWFLLVKVLFKPEIDEIPGGRDLIRSELSKLGPMSQGEIRVIVVFIATALAWIIIPTVAQLNGGTAIISDAGIAMVAGVVLFMMPAGAERGVRLLDWKTAKELPWDVLLLFGGGLALSSMFSKSGLTKDIGTFAGKLDGVPPVLVVAILAAAILFLTELTSNTATAATFIPVAMGIASGMGADPLLFAAPVALAATCAFMLPVATPPNAVAYGSGYVTIGEMVKGGVWLNLIGIGVITLACSTLLVWVFGLAL
ncbi:SLC13 family permease [Pseudoglutamicibacter albus]|uniref:Sodium-dependent dicarboxylate transporter SdcS n=1 Tax=Pseudoglutamicibacter albus TaxID=98671 RepID=A0ABU1YWR2_9MICC|nr:DASS family sodium-coupled anion symporter [Pseudoglutamicibacter albus]MDR7292798.1 sodium-dependent dicarboxylate transporter 2/3/5 [Pseudoglutamicibacter albus]